MTTSIESRDAFLRLQPFCVAVCKDRNAESLTALTDAFDRIPDDETLQRLQDYSLYPLKLILKLREQRTISKTSETEGTKSPGLPLTKIPKDKTVESAIRCLRAVLKRTFVDNAATAVDLFTLLLSTIGHPKNGGRVDVGVGEDLKEEVVVAAECLLRKCDDDVRKQLCTVDFLPLWGHAVATFLSMAECEAGTNLVVAALKALVTFEEVLPRDEASVCFATFLPGIVVACLKLTTRDEKQNHRINCEALRLLTSSVSLVLSNNGEDANNSKDRIWKTLNASPSKSNLLVQPTTEWRKNTWEKLGVVINKLSQSVSSNHPNWKVRLASLTLVQTVIVECQREDYEKHCSSAFVEMTVSRLDDENPEVKRLSERIVDQLRAVGSGDDGGGSKLLRDAAATLLQKATRNLPRIFRRVNDDEKRREIQAIKGYVTVLGQEGVETALMSPSGSINKLLLAFMQILEMDVEDLRIIQRLPSNTLNTLADAYEGFKPKIRFRLFTDERVLTGIEGCLRLLGRLSEDNLYALCDYLVEYLESRNESVDGDLDDDDAGNGSTYEKQTVFVLNAILIGVSEDKAEKRKGKKRKDEESRKTAITDTILPFVRDTLLPLYLSDALLHAQCEAASNEDVRDSTRKPVSSNSTFLVDSTPTRSIHDLHSSVARSSVSTLVPRFNSNILLVVLSLEGISLCAGSIEVAFRPLLIKALYPVVEKVASEITMIQDAAYSALRQMALGCGYATVSQLLLTNSDYVVNQLRSELRHGFILCRTGKLSSDAPRVLAAMLKNAGPELLPVLRDTVEEVFLCLDTTGAYQPERAKVFLKVLSALMFYVNLWFSSSGKEAGEKKKASSETRYTKEFWEEYVKNSNAIEEALRVDGENFEDIPENGDDFYEEPTPEEPPLPYYARLTEEVMTRCIYYLPDEDPRIRVLVLDVMQKCCEALAAHENTLLPLAHKCWSAFVCRLKDKDRHVALKAFETLVALSRTCGDFLLPRFSKDVLPALTTFMTSQGRVSAGLVAKSCPFRGVLLEIGEERSNRRAREEDVGSGSAYRFTVAYKLQLAVLKGIGTLCQTIEANVETGLDKIVDFLLLHLRSSQPLELQDAAKDALVALGAVDADLVWMRVSAEKGDFPGGKLRDVNEPRPASDGLSPDVLTEIIQALSCDDKDDKCSC